MEPHRHRCGVGRGQTPSGCGFDRRLSVFHRLRRHLTVMAQQLTFPVAHKDSPLEKRIAATIGAYRFIANLMR